MTPHTKKLIGTLVTLLWLVAYSLIAMHVGLRILPHAGQFVTFFYYFVVGTAWAVPVGLLLPWMYRGRPNT